MSVTNIEKNPAAKTLVVTADFDAPVPRVWQMWNDPRQLERWWGPPGWPATFTEHDLAPDGRIVYYMTGPQGDRNYGWWRVRSVSAPHKLEFEEGFADETGAPNNEMPVSVMRVTLTEDGDRTRMVIETTFPSDAAMEQLLKMGMAEGFAEAIGQIDALLKA